MAAVAEVAGIYVDGIVDAGDRDWDQCVDIQRDGRDCAAAAGGAGSEPCDDGSGGSGAGEVPIRMGRRCELRGLEAGKPVVWEPSAFQAVFDGPDRSGRGGACGSVTLYRKFLGRVED